MCFCCGGSVYFLPSPNSIRVSFAQCIHSCIPKCLKETLVHNTPSLHIFEWMNDLKDKQHCEKDITSIIGKETKGAENEKKCLNDEKPRIQAKFFPVLKLVSLSCSVSLSRRHVISPVSVCLSF